MITFTKYRLCFAYFKLRAESFVASLSLICSSVKYRIFTFLGNGLTMSEVSCYFDLPRVVVHFLQCELIESAGRNEVVVRSPHIGIVVGHFRFYKVHHHPTNPVIFTNTETLPQMFWYKGRSTLEFFFDNFPQFEIFLICIVISIVARSAISIQVL